MLKITISKFYKFCTVMHCKNESAYAYTSNKYPSIYLSKYKHEYLFTMVAKMFQKKRGKYGLFFKQLYLACNAPYNTH